MESNKHGDVHGRISRVLDALLEISETEVVVQNNVSLFVEDNGRRIDSLLSAIESNTSELHEIIVVKGDKDTSKDSGNTSLTEVCFNLRKSWQAQAGGWGGGDSYKMTGDACQKFSRNALKGARILFDGHGLNGFLPLRGTKSKSSGTHIK